MSPLERFTIPVKGLRDGIHTFSFDLKSSFFKEVNTDSEIDSDLLAKVDFDKRPSMFILNMQFSGVLNTSCDRCLQDIVIKIDDQHELIIKRGLGEGDGDVVYFEKWPDEFNISKYIYDYAVLSCPITKTCEMTEASICDDDMLSKLNADEASEVTDNKAWDVLKKLKL